MPIDDLINVVVPPPAETPPAETPPAETPPVETPPAETPPAETPPADRSFIPEEYKDKSYLQDAKDAGDVFKKLDSLETLLGKKRVVNPTEESTEAEWNEFYAAKGRPEEAEGYADIEGESALYDALKPAFHAAGFNDLEVKKFLEAANPIVANIAKEQGVQKLQDDAAFDKMFEEQFGTRQAEVLSNSSKLLTKYTPEGLKDSLSTLDNRSLTIISGVLDGVYKDFITEGDRIPTAPSAAPGDIAALEAKGSTLIAEIQNGGHNIETKTAMNKECQDIYRLIEKLKK